MNARVGPAQIDDIVARYFKELDDALSELPRDRRTQLVAELRQHVDQALAVREPNSEPEVRELLARVGSPSEIAAAALSEEGIETLQKPWRLRPVVLSVVVLALVGGLVAGLVLSLGAAPARQQSHSSQSTSSTTTTSQETPSTTTPVPSNRTVLAPATVPPVSNECKVQLVYDADGNVSPLLCPNGGVNVQAWDQYTGNCASGQSQMCSKTLSLGPYASPTQVWQAMCSDYATLYRTNPLTISAEELAQAYYGWQFAGDNPAQDFQHLGCPAR